VSFILTDITQQPVVINS